MEKPKPEAPGGREPAADRDDVHLATNRCPYCHVDVRPDADDGVVCKACLARHHAACWDEAAACAACGGAVRLAEEAGPAAGPETAEREPADRSRAGSRRSRGLAVTLLAVLGLVAGLGVLFFFLLLVPASGSVQVREAEVEGGVVEESASYSSRGASGAERTQPVVIEEAPIDDSPGPVDSSPAPEGYELGREAAEAGQYRRALDHFDRAVAVDPDYPDTYRLRGHAREELGDLSGAASDYVHFLELVAADHPQRSEVRSALRGVKGAVEAQPEGE